MAEAQLQQFLDKVRQLNAFVALSEADPQLRQQLRQCEHHDEVVALARRCGFEIGRRWGEPLPQSSQTTGNGATSPAGSEPPPGGPLGSAVTMARGFTASEPQPAADSHAGPAGAADPVTAGTSPSGLSDGLHSLLSGPCPPPGEEVTEVLLETPQWRLERIHSCSYQSPEGFWYEQDQEEWVLLLQGSAALRFADQPGEQRLGPGESLRIRAGRRHRVTATDPAPGTIWLALFWRPA